MKTLRACAIVSVLAGSWAGVQASQCAGHIYVALKAREQAPPAVKGILEAQEAAYLAGATGPDIALTAYLVAEAMEWSHPGAEAHYEKTGELIVNMLRLAAANPDEAARQKELAFGLGWLTHYYTDCVVHPLINEFGGYYGAGGEHQVRHKRLELLECSHVYQKGLGDLERQYVIQSAAVPITLIRRAFAATFPQKSVYAPKNNEGIIANVYSFDSDLSKSATLMAQASSWLVSAYRGETNPVRGPVFSSVLKGYPPTSKEYAALRAPLRIESVEMEPPPETGVPPADKRWLKIVYTINDLSLCDLFLREWDRRIGQASSAAAAAFSRYATDPDHFTLPNINLDTGAEEGSVFEANKAWPGAPRISSVLTFAEITDPEGQDVSLTDKSGQFIPIPFAKGAATISAATPEPNAWKAFDTISTGKGWNGELTGTAYLKIPFTFTKAGEYHVKIRLAFACEADKRLYGWPERDTIIEATWEGDVPSISPELSILFLVDTSGSMAGNKLAEAQAAVKAAVDRTNDGRTEWALLRFGGCRVTAVCRFTMDPRKIKAATEALQASGDTPLVYAREKALRYLVQRGRGKQGRLIILCDGQDNCSEHGSISQPEAAAQLKRLMTEIQNMPLPEGGH